MKLQKPIQSSLFVGFFVTLGFVVSQSFIPDRLHDKFLLPVSFQLRSFLGRAPTLSTQLKLIVIDSRVMSYLKKDDFTEEDWISIFSTLEKLGAKKVIVDRILGNPMAGSGEAIKGFANRADRKTKFFSTAFIQENPIDTRVELPKTFLPFHIQDLKSPSIKGWMTPKEAFLYGADVKQSRIFTNMGHANFEGYRIPVAFALKPDWMLPHLAFYATNEENIADAIPETSDGTVLPNYVDSDYLWSKSVSLMALYTERAHEFVKEGDTVLLLTSMMTGGAHAFESPFGPYHPSFLLASLANSVLDGKWIRTWKTPTSLLAVAPIASGLVIFISNASIALGLVFFSVVILVGSQLFLFILSGVEWNISSLVLAIGCSGGAISFLRAYLDQKKLGELRRSLEGYMDSRRLNNLMKNPQRIRWSASTREVTILVIDMAGFSRIAERREPAEVYHHLKSTITRITETVHEFDGIVDRTLGDGVLAFFGYNFSDLENDPNHAVTALKCAMEIQRRHLDILSSVSDQEFIHPLRIGINTAKVHVGDLGDSKRVDFTIVGHGVNFAQRLENACSDFAILCSPETKARVSRDKTLNFYPKKIPVKHSSELVEVFELDPLEKHAKQKSEAIQRYRKLAFLERETERQIVPAEWEIRVDSKQFKGVLHDFSRGGFHIVSDVGLGRGAVLEVEIDGNHECLVEVRWCSHAGDNFHIGFKYVDKSESRLNSHFDKLTEIVAKHRNSLPKAA